MTALLALALLAPALQDDVAAKVRKLADALGAQDVADRDQAEMELLALGAKAREALKPLAAHADAEIRARVKRLLGRAAMLPMDDAVRDAFKAFEDDELKSLFAGAEALLKADRAKAKAGLKAAADEGHDLLKFRAKQLLDVLADEPAIKAVRYGIILARAEYRPEEPVAGVELWINDSGGELALQDVPACADVQFLDPKPALEGTTFTLEEPAGEKSKAFALRAGAHLVRESADLSGGGGADSETKHAGRYSIRRVYASDDEQTEPSEKKVWFGKARSNRVEFRVK